MKQSLLLLAVVAIAGSAGAAATEPAVQAPAVQNAGLLTAAPDITLQGCSGTESAQALADATAPEPTAACCTAAEKSACSASCAPRRGISYCTDGACQCDCAGV